MVVAIPVYGALGLLSACLRSVLTNTPEDVWILVADDASPQDVRALVLEFDGPTRRLAYHRQPSNQGFVANVNRVFDLTNPADVVVLNSDVEVAAGWLERLRSAAFSDTLVATATPLTNNGTLISVPDRNRPQRDLPEGWSLERAAAAIADASPQLRPRIPTAIGHCMYVRRPAIELVGGLDTAFAPAYGEEVDFSQRCAIRGLSHVVADDVFVLHHGQGSYGDGGSTIRERHERLIADRYPYYHQAVAEAAKATSGPLVDSLAAARRALGGLSVTIDGSCLGTTVTGTQIHTLEVIQALAETEDVRLRVAVPATCGSFARQLLDRTPGVETIVWEEIDTDTVRSDVVHRPCQVGRSYEFRRLFALGERVVITQQDFIAYRNPSYFSSFEEWQEYRRLARLSLAIADRSVFFSEHALREARAEHLVEPDRSVVVPIGVHHRHAHLVTEPIRPSRADHLLAGQYLLCLGTDFTHKNRLFALQVVLRMIGRQRWRGRLVLAGPHARPGSSAPAERAFLLAHPELQAVTTDLGPVSEGEKRWLLENAALVLAPTVYEGFGLIPAEAGQAGVPCLYAAQTSLAEVLPRECALIVPWDPAATADAALRLIHDQELRRWLVQTIQAACQQYSWDDTAARLVRVYRDAVCSPPPTARAFEAALMTSGIVTSKELAALDPRKVWHFWRAFGFFEGSRRGAAGVLRRLRRAVAGAHA
jgi:glycosyltransferase involved in cell wall biosynthesis